jgi:hypothetical protein
MSEDWARDDEKSLKRAANGTRMESAPSDELRSLSLGFIHFS